MYDEDGVADGDEGNEEEEDDDEDDKIALHCWREAGMMCGVGAIDEAVTVDADRWVERCRPGKVVVWKVKLV